MRLQVIEVFDTIFGWTGRRIIVATRYVLELTIFCTASITDWVRRGHVANPATRAALSSQLIFTGVDALPVITLLAVIIGVAFSSQILFVLFPITTAREITQILGSLITIELSTLITAIVLIGRSGSAIAVDLGNMALHKEIEGLEMLGINVRDFFVAPRLIGASISQLALATYFAGIATFGGVFFSGLIFSDEYLKLIPLLLTDIHPAVLGLFILKNLLFGIIIAGTACFHALHVKRSPTEVPQQTQRAIVNGLLLIFVVDGITALARF